MALANYIWKLHTTSFISSVTDKGIFIIQSESLKTCIQAGKSVLTLENCTQPNEYMLWKWVSDNHLFNVGASGCLGLNISDLKRPLSLYECDSTLISLRWLCDRKTIVGPLQYKVQVNHSTVVAKKTPHKWSAYMPGGGDICEHLHRGKCSRRCTEYVDSISQIRTHIYLYVHICSTCNFTYISFTV